VKHSFDVLAKFLLFVLLSDFDIDKWYRIVSYRRKNIEFFDL